MIKKILIATGGTGGHVFPAYSLANILNKDYEIILSTDKRGFKYIKNFKNLNVIEIPSSPLVKEFIQIFVIYIHYHIFYNKIFFIFIT